jgi:hypothetical protein
VYAKNGILGICKKTLVFCVFLSQTAQNTLRAAARALRAFTPNFCAGCAPRAFGTLKSSNEVTQMDATKPRTANRLGMFDVLKGLGMLAIIFSHTLDSYSLGVSGGTAVPAFVLAIHSDMLMAAFFIMSGYGFRPRPVGKCIRQQGKALLRPYLYTALATAALHLALHYGMFRNWHNAVVETLRVLGGFALGLPHTAT